jgi:hypothetical protein
VLSAWRRLVPADTPRAVRVNLAIVLAFALVAVLMLARTLVSAVRIDADVGEAINPELAAVGTDTLNLPVLDRTRQLAEAIDAAARPLHPSLAESARQNADVAATLREIRADTEGIGASVSGIDMSVTGIRASLGALGPVLSAIAAQTGDIRRELADIDTVTTGVAEAVRGIDDLLGRTARDVSLVRGSVGQVRASAGEIAAHADNIAGSRVLALADLLLGRPDLAQLGDITAGPAAAPTAPRRGGAHVG